MPDTRLSNQVAMAVAAQNALADIATARAMLAGGGPKWDNLTPAARTAFIDGLLADMNGVIRYLLNMLDVPA